MHGIASYFTRNALQALLVLVAASFLVFLATEATPGSVARKMLGEFATEEQVKLLNEEMRLNDPAVVRYFRWAGALLGLSPEPLGPEAAIRLGLSDTRGETYFGNFGYSTFYKRPVNDVLWERLTNSAILAGIAFALIIVVGLSVGIIAGLYPGSMLDRSFLFLSLLTTSLPQYVWGVLLVTIFVFNLQMVPGTSTLSASSDWSIFAQLVLPVATLFLVDFGYVAAMIRTTISETMAKPFVRTAYLKGMTRRQVVIKHVLRNALIAPFTIILLQFNFLITGVVVTEVIFSYPGFGQMLLSAALNQDVAVVQGATIVAVVIAIATQLAGDAGYGLLDPRIRTGNRK